ncbi:hypothetical protein SAPIO_CDS8662 [Scedosporium apiospermum]|uniref:Letm1 RBD domain-containing protein n=1 Tax=Pseudallescheria apiosperma TaxID=563466 RepID=A0A084G059_PSEDA|nr:uncharacterized protein SAPIO_CDS8662 [Scedosporium apiospermum]KEZ40721.1 hypothetical protein SAPIO_CDS8662 [Scedosporium apiospermum]
MEANLCLRALRKPLTPAHSSQFFALYSLPLRARRFSTRSSATPPETTDLTTDDGINPPRTTLPPPLELPIRNPTDGTFSHLFKLGKAYVGFYKTGLKNVFVNRRLLKNKVEALPTEDRPSIFKPHHIPRAFSRSDWILLWRVRHDMGRLPVFAVVVLLFEELTPLVAYAFEGIMPHTCRLPQHLEKSRKKAVARRKHAFEELGWKNPDGVSQASVAQVHILRSLNLVSTLWDRVGLIPPGLWQLRGRSQVAFLEVDDALLRKAGKLSQLSAEELMRACSERGIDLEPSLEEADERKKEHERRRLLEQWLRLTDAQESAERRRRMAVLLTTRPENWPKKPDFALPSWSI